jgi:hypothetical protein
MSTVPGGGSPGIQLPVWPLSTSLGGICAPGGQLQFSSASVPSGHFLRTVPHVPSLFKTGTKHGPTSPAGARQLQFVGSRPHGGSHFGLHVQSVGQKSSFLAHFVSGQASHAPVFLFLNGVGATHGAPQRSTLLLSVQETSPSSQHLHVAMSRDPVHGSKH